MGQVTVRRLKFGCIYVENQQKSQKATYWLGPCDSAGRTHGISIAFESSASSVICIWVDKIGEAQMQWNRRRNPQQSYGRQHVATLTQRKVRSRQSIAIWVFENSDLALKGFSIAMTIPRRWTTSVRHRPGHALRRAVRFAQDFMTCSCPSSVTSATLELAEGAWQDSRRMLSKSLVGI